MANLSIAIQVATQDQSSGPIGRITNALGGLKDAAQRGFAGLQNVATMAGGALTIAAGIGGSALLGIGGAAFDMATDLEAATADIQAELRTTTEDAERLGDIALDVFGDNFADNLGEAGQAVALVRQQLGDLADDELERATENAFRLNDVFEVETPESINKAQTLMEEFGLTSDQAFDFIASGFQRGLNSSGDFLDSIGEYSNLFADSGFSADQFFSIMESGSAGGVLGTDKISDAVKEMGIILNEGGDEAREVFDQIGLDFDQIAGFVRSGDEAWADYFPNIIDGINAIEDPIERSQAQVAIFGTMAEDLGVSFTEGLSAGVVALDDMEGAVGSLDAKYDTLGSVVEGFQRRALVAITPIGEILLEIANNAMPLVDDAFGFFETNIIPNLETAADVVNSFIGNLEEGMSPLNAFIEAIWDIAPPEVLDTLVSLRDEVLPGLSTWFTDNVQPVTDMVAEFVSWQDVFMALGIVGASIVLPALYGIVAAAAPVIAVGTALVGAIALARNAWENDWGGIRTAVGNAVTALQPYWDRLQVALDQFWQEIIPALQEVWLTLIDVWQTDLQPAISDLWSAFGELFEALGIGTGETDFLSAALGALKIGLDLVVLVVEVLSPLIEAWGNNVSFAVGYVTQFVEGITSMKRGLDAVLAPLDRVADRIGNMVDEALSMPGWLIPGSPTPFEIGLRGIGSAINQLPPLELAPSGQNFSLVGGGGLIPAGATASGGGISIGSITIQANSEAEGRAAGRGFVDELRKRGLL